MSTLRVHAKTVEPLTPDEPVEEPLELGLRPTRHAAVIVPPVVVFAGMLVFTAAVAVLSFGGWYTMGVGRAMLLAALSAFRPAFRPSRRSP